MESTTPVSSHQKDEISLKDLILQIQDWSMYLWRKWFVILAFGLLGAGLGLVYALTSKPKYVAALTFVLEDAKGSSLSTYANLAGQFGIDLGGESGSGVFSGDNIIEFLKSRLMVEKAMLSPIIRKGKVQSLADYYIEMNALRQKESWQKNTALKNLQFPLNSDRRTFSRLQDSILNTFYISIITNALKVTKPDKKLSFISVECTTRDEVFCKIFTEHLVKEAIDFYVSTKTKQSKSTVDKLQAKADSLEFLLNRTTYSVAASQDMNLNPARSMAGVKTELASRDKVMIQTMYVEMMKNLELSKMAMAQETPIIQIVDTPILPLKKEKTGILKGVVIGGGIGGIILIVFLLIKRMYKIIMTK